MSILPIIQLPDPILRKSSKAVERVDVELCSFLDSMSESMYSANGIGLAAVQVGELLRVITIDCGQTKAGDEPLSKELSKELRGAEESRPHLLHLINPEIVDVGSDISIYDEGCLSIPDYLAEIERPAECTVSYIDRAGKKKELKADGLLATCLQHEIDHLNGKLFIDYLSRLKRDSVVRKFTKIARHEKSDSL